MSDYIIDFNIGNSNDGQQYMSMMTGYIEANPLTVISCAITEIGSQKYQYVILNCYFMPAIYDGLNYYISTRSLW